MTRNEHDLCSYCFALNAPLQHESIVVLASNLFISKILDYLKKMHTFQTIVLCAFASVATAVPLGLYSSTTPIPILRQNADGPNPDGSYNYNYETANGIQAQEIGYLNYRGTQAESREAQGSYSYTAPNGEIISVSYVANENGFQPQGSHIPSVPPAILKALEYIAAHREERLGAL